MSEEVKICPLCSGQSNVVFDVREFHGRSVTNRLCQDCGLVFQSPRMTEAESMVFYAEEYRLLNEGSAEPTIRNISAQKGRVESLVAFARPNIEEVNRHLDIGCSMGILLQSFQRIYHCQSIGVEPGEAHRNLARKEGLTVYPALDELERWEKDPFDLISMAHVLEHLPDPVGYLLHLREKVLDKTGWLLIEVPNLYAHDSFEKAHLVSYSARTLTQTLEKAGFVIVHLEKHGRPRSMLIPLYITALACPMLNAGQHWNRIPEHQVAFKRRLGMLRRRVCERLFPGQAWRQ
jgi:2-polyprenyl-3-methyl-5-hydroxy-6-metoxy-1,4-benzoquinol methylase